MHKSPLKFVRLSMSVPLEHGLQISLTGMLYAPKPSQHNAESSGRTLLACPDVAMPHNMAWHLLCQSY